MAKMNLVREFTKGIIKENPVLCLVLGTCPTLAVTTAASNAIGMGIAATIVLVCSNAVISLLRKIIPDKVRIPAYITIIAGFVTMVQMLVKAYAPDIDKALGIYLPLIVVNCIILGRAEMYASKHSVLPSVLDGLGMGVGFTAAMLAMGIIREFFGTGAVFGVPIFQGVIDPHYCIYPASRQLLCVRNADCFGKQAFRQQEKAGGDRLRRLPHERHLLQAARKGGL